jgi:coenzyme Q-binding protein COQ10
MTDTQHVQRRVRHRPQDVFTLVSDVQDYPNFIKWIRGMHVRENHVEGGVGDLTARAIIGYKFVRERFTTRVELNEPEGKIYVTFVDGPFSVLENRWQFHALEDGSTLVDFWIRYRFKNPLLQKLLEANVGRAANTLITSFEGRARERFDTIGAPHSETTRLISAFKAAQQTSQSV